MNNCKIIRGNTPEAAEIVKSETGGNQDATAVTEGVVLVSPPAMKRIPQMQHRKITITVETVCKCGDMYMHHKQILLTPRKKVPLADCVPMRSSQEPMNESSAKNWIKFNRALRKDSVMRNARRHSRHRPAGPRCHYRRQLKNEGQANKPTENKGGQTNG